MTPATAAAVSLLERLRTLAESWTETRPPRLGDLRTSAGLPEVLDSVAEFTAMGALLRTGYYIHSTRVFWLPELDKAIAALKGETT